MIFDWHKQVWGRLPKSGREVPQALLLTGRRGTGKVEFARAYARTILCEDTDIRERTGMACGRCGSCGWFQAGSHPDYRQVEPAALSAQEPGEGEAAAPEKSRTAGTRISVDQIRALSDMLYTTTHRSGHRIVLIQPAESMNTNAANALLKSLEEPPPATLFLLVSHRPALLPPTVRSRCRHIALPLPTREAAVNWLRGQDIEDPGLALSLSGNAPLTAGLASDPAYWNERRRFLDAISAGGSSVPARADKLSAMDPVRLVNWLQTWTYDIVSLKLAGHVRYHVDQRSLLEAVSHRVDARAAAAAHRHFVHAQRTVQHPLNATLLAESLMREYVRLIEPSSVSRATH